MATTETEMSTERRFTNLLRELLEEHEPETESGAVATVESFAEQGVMTLNEGLVVRLGSGEEFQVTVVRSR